MASLRVASCQLNPTVGDLDGNVDAVLDALARAEDAGCDLAAFTELVITGYPPEDLLLKPGFVAAGRAAMEKVAARSGRCAAIVGFVDAEDGVLYNAAAVCAGGELRGVYRKRLLPNYSVFDEERYFEPGTGPLDLYVIGSVSVGVSICEDAWSRQGPVPALASGGAELLVNINGSPYYAGRPAERERMLSALAADTARPLLYVNQVGGQDELVFDGASLAFDARGEVIFRAPQFATDVSVFDIDVPRVGEATLQRVAVSDSLVPRTDTLPPSVAEPLPRVREVYEALVLGTRDYVAKNGFSEVVVGLSGGVDSSLVAAIAVDALGPERVHGVMMPSRFSSAGSLADARALVENLGIDSRVIPIEPAHQAYLEMLAPSFADLGEDLTEENLQARVRGTTLMALSNKFGWLVLTTGNKSEMAVGYSTLYGDMAGGFAVIKDVPKMLVYELCRDRNERAGRPLIPEPVLTKAPSAELRPDQRDEDSLLPYEELDPLLEKYVEGDTTVGELEAAGFDAAAARAVVAMVDRAEYKRRQGPPGPRVTPKAFGKDRRLPITNRYRG
jgi:NAD+ synthase (glutamine-hydrolysing)